MPLLRCTSTLHAAGLPLGSAPLELFGAWRGSPRQCFVIKSEASTRSVTPRDPPPSPSPTDSPHPAAPRRAAPPSTPPAPPSPRPPARRPRRPPPPRAHLRVQVERQPATCSASPPFSLSTLLSTLYSFTAAKPGSPLSASTRTTSLQLAATARDHARRHEDSHPSRSTDSDGHLGRASPPPRRGPEEHPQPERAARRQDVDGAGGAAAATTRKATVTTGGSTNNTTANSRDRACVAQVAEGPKLAQSRPRNSSPSPTPPHPASSARDHSMTDSPPHTIWVSPRRAMRRRRAEAERRRAARAARRPALPTLRVPVAAGASPFDAETQMAPVDDARRGERRPHEPLHQERRRAAVARADRHRPQRDHVGHRHRRRRRPRRHRRRRRRRGGGRGWHALVASTTSSVAQVSHAGAPSWHLAAACTSTWRRTIRSPRRS